MMKKLLFISCFLYSLLGWGQTNYDWLNTAPDGNWRQGASGERWNPGGLWDEPPFGILRFDNNHQLSMTNNVAGTYNTYMLLFQPNNNQVRTISGNPIRFFDFGGNNPKIENFSSATHILNFNISGDGDIDDPIEINLQGTGGLTFGGTINNQGGWLNFFGSNNAVARFNGIISGSGGLGIKTNTIVALNANNTYSGNTEIDQGELWIGENGNIATGTTVFIGNGGQTTNVAKFFLADPDGGQNFSNTITINNGNGLTRYIGSLNTSGTNTISGAISKSNLANLNFEVVNAGGTLAITGGLNAGTNATILRKFGPGRLVISSNDFNTNTLGDIFLRNGILEVDLFPSRFGGSRAITLGDDGLSTLRINETSENHSGAININSNNGVIEFNSTTQRQYTSIISFGANTLTINNQSSVILDLNGNQTGTGTLNINSTGPGLVLLTRSSYDRTGNTVINSGTLRYNPTANSTFNSKLVLNGGTFSTQVISAGRTITSTAPLQLTNSSSIVLSTSAHTLTFANSSGESWTGTLTITGWSGTPGSTGFGTAGRIFIGNNNSTLTTVQLNSINFVNYAPGAELTESGELVPRDFLRFYSVASGDANNLSNWNTQRNGSGIPPTAFTSPRSFFYVQNGHTMTTSATWTVNGANNHLIVESGGILQGNHPITLNNSSTFTIEDNGRYIHNNNSSLASNIYQGIENFSAYSFVELLNWPSGSFASVSQYGNLTLNANTNNTIQFNNNLVSILGDFVISNTGTGQITLTASTGSNTQLNIGGNFILNNGTFNITNGSTSFNVSVNGNVELNGGTFRFQDANIGAGSLIMNGQNVTISSGLTIAGNTPGNSGFYFNRNGVQNVSIGQAFASGNYRDRFFYNASQTTLNETYNGTVAQETVNGNGATPLTGYSAWPTSGNHLRNLTINNTAGVTLRNNRSINENLVLTNGTLTAAINTTLVFQGDQINRTNGFLNFSATGATLEMNSNTLKTFPTGLFSSSISNLHINGSGGVKANQDLNITNNLSLNQSNPNLTDGLLDMVIDYGSYATTANPDSTNPDNNLNSYTLNMVGNATTIGNGDVTGKIRRSGIVSGNTYTFGNKNMQLTFNGTNLPAYIEVVATKGNKGLHVDKDGIGDLPGTDVSPIGGAAVKRLYQIKRSGGDTPTTFTIRLPYNTNELNGNSENDLVIWDHHLPYNGVTPHEHGKTSLNTSEKYIELEGHGIRYLALDGAIPIVGTFSTTKYWMISQKETTDVLWLGAATDDWNIPSNWTSGSVPDFDTKIVIPQVPTYQNELQVEGTVEVASIDVKNNASFVAKNNAVVQVKGGVLSNGGIGSWNNQGNFVAEPGSKIIFENPNATVAGNSKFHDLEVKNGGKLTIAANTVVEVVGNLVNFGELDANSTENTIRFVGTNQTIPATNGLGLAYRNIEINQIDDSSEVTMTGSIEINGTLSIPSGKLKVENNTLTLRGAFPEEAQKIITTNQSRLEFRNSGTGTKVIPDFSSINDIVVDTNLQLEASANLNVHGNINVNKGTLNLGIFNWNRNSLGGTLSLGNQGKLLIGGNNTLPSSFSVHDFDTDSEVAYVGGNQTIKKPTNTYGNLRLAGTGDKIFEESESLIEISKDLLIEGGHLKVGEDKTLKVTNQFNNLSGLATFETGASLLQVNNVVNNGNITYKRTTGDLKNFDFVYWGAMVHNPLIKDMWMTNASETFYRFNPVTNNWVLLSGNTPMIPGIGYIARARFNSNWGSGPTPPSALPWTATYIARPNNGNVEVDIFQDKFHLIANPYPSALDAKAFIQQGGDFTTSPFLPTIFIWTQASGINNNQYQSSDYAAFNLFTETPDALNPSGYTVSRYVGAGQGFFVRTKNVAMPNPAIATFTNNHRVAGNNVNFTKPGKNKNQTNSVVFMQKYWLKLSNSLGNTKQTAIVHHPEGSISYDPIQDSPAFNGNATLNLFSLSENQRMAVNVTSPIQITDEIPIGFTTTQPGSHSISLAHLENISESQDIYLLDQVLSVTHNIKQGPYTFTSIAGTFNERFKIVFQNQTLSTPEISTANWIVFAKENNIHAQTGNDLIDQISIYDLNGRLLYQKQNILDNNLLIPWNFNQQVFLVQLIDTNGISYKTKVLLP